MGANQPHQPASAECRVNDCDVNPTIRQRLVFFRICATPGDDQYGASSVQSARSAVSMYTSDCFHRRTGIFPEKNCRGCSSLVSMDTQQTRDVYRRPNIKPTLGQYLVLSGYCHNQLLSNLIGNLDIV